MMPPSPIRPAQQRRGHAVATSPPLLLRRRRHPRSQPVLLPPVVISPLPPRPTRALHGARWPRQVIQT
ncbi:hypothetical protein GUJ93_ZPchr0005g14367 [Zizania palustris]|uniref:Uncharacterized protein n=1 Tax=Zizania palustris TaxID=103762 RepID=A0A8J5S3Y5_ZIZPA|nr:hypothetical protein GUJ93_ZPchr0005g14367 [Zizania palustris]